MSVSGLRGAETEIGHTTAPADAGAGIGESEQLEGGGADHGDRADGMKSW